MPNSAVVHGGIIPGLIIKSGGNLQRKHPFYLVHLFSRSIKYSKTQN